MSIKSKTRHSRVTVHQILFDNRLLATETWIEICSNNLSLYIAIVTYCPCYILNAC